MYGRRTAALLTLLLLVATSTAGLAGSEGEDRAAGDWVQSSGGLASSGTYFGCTLGDVNGDGKLDVVAASDGDGVRVFLGNGLGGWSAVTSHPATSGGYGDVCLGDFDGDGKVDIFAGSPGNSNSNPKGLHVWRGDGTGGFTEVTSGSGLPTSGYWRGVAVDDINGDGDLDLAASNGYGTSEGVHVYVGDGTGRFTDDSTGLPGNQDRDSKVALADLDNDGDLDLVAGGGAGLDAYLAAKGPLGNLVWTQSSVGLTNSRMSGISAVDWDRDGLVDIVTSAYNGGGGDGVIAYKNSRSGTMWNSASDGLPTSGDYIENSVADLNGDGHLDLVVAGSYGGTYGIHVYEGDGQGKWTENSTGFTDDVQYVGLDTGDVNGDGALDIVAGKRSRGGGIEVWINPAAGAPPSQPELTLASMTGGESLTGGSQHTVEWTVDAGTPPYTVDIQYSVDGGSTFPQTVASDVDQSDVGTGTHGWTVPVINSHNVRVRVEVTDTEGMSVSRYSPQDLEVDSTPPTVSTTFPRDGATGVSTTTPVVITFDEGMATASTDAVSITGPGSPGLVSPSWSGTQLTLETQGLAADSEYAVTISEGARDDSEPGNALSSALAFSFTTGSGETPAPPIVDGTAPVHDARSVSIMSSVTIEFSKAMEPAVTEDAVSVSPPVDWTASWSPDGRDLTLDPSSDLTPNTRFTVTVGTTAMATDGTLLDATYSFFFTTGDPPDLTPPTVVATSPPAHQREVDPTSAVVTITFSEPMARTATENALDVSGGTVSAFEWNADATVVTLVIDLEYGTRYTISAGTSAQDPSGNGLRETFTFFFVTEDPPYEEGGKGLGSPLLPLLLVAMTLALLASSRGRGR